MDALSSSEARRYSLHALIDGVLPIALILAGFLHPESPSRWFMCLGLGFVALWAPLLGSALLCTFLAERKRPRIQGDRSKPAPFVKEALETSRAAVVASCLMAWPLTQWQLGHPTGMVWHLEGGALGVLRALVQTFAGVMIIDAWLYWKHRLLHTRALFGFHKAHHAFRDPSPLAGFAVAPVEALLTFWPILILCIPEATHWAPLYFALVIGFVHLNFYLHSGVTIGLVERLLPKLYVNTSLFHNVHHARANTHFGEALTLWDTICKTRIDRPDAEAVAAGSPGSPSVL
ncbi:MAG: sterol desaturase family protein [Byssovorax sp.]